MTRIPSSPRANVSTPDRRPNVVLVRGGRDDRAPAEEQQMSPSDALAHGVTVTPDSSGLIGKVLSDRYFIERLLGEGGMGKVYLAEHLLMHKKLAVKVLRQGMTRRPEAVARFEREAMAAAHIDHPNVASAKDFGKLDDGSFFLVLEYIEGTDLFSVIGEGPLAPERALHIAHQIASALSRAHALGIVHRDLKPENVMLVERDGDSSFVKVLDFGIAKLTTRTPGEGPRATPQSITQAGAVSERRNTLRPSKPSANTSTTAPTSTRSASCSSKCSRASVLTNPIGMKNVLSMKLVHTPPTLASKNPATNVSPAVEAIVTRLLARHVDKRFQDANQVLDAIEASGSWKAKTRASVRPGPAPAHLARSGAPDLASTLDAPTRLEILRIVRSRSREAWSTLIATATRAIRSLLRKHATWPRPLRRALPPELLAGMVAGLLLALVTILRVSRSVAERGGIPTRPVDSMSVDAATARSSWSAQPLLLRTEEARQTDTRTDAATNASGRTVSPKTPARRKSIPGLTDFGGRQ